MIVEISSNLQLRCSWKRRWTNSVLRFERSRSRRDQIWSKKAELQRVQGQSL